MLPELCSRCAGRLVQDVACNLYACKAAKQQGLISTDWLCTFKQYEDRALYPSRGKLDALRSVEGKLTVIMEQRHGLDTWKPAVTLRYIPGYLSGKLQISILELTIVVAHPRSCMDQTPDSQALRNRG